MNRKLVPVGLSLALLAALAACTSAPPGEWSGQVSTSIGDGRAAPRPGQPLIGPYDAHSGLGALRPTPPSDDAAQ